MSGSEVSRGAGAPAGAGVRAAAPEGPGPVGEAPPDSRWRRALWALMAVQLLLLLHGAWRVGPTFDEHYYIASGYSYLLEGDFSLNREHPPLLKLLAGLPLLLFGDVTLGGTGADGFNFPVGFFYQHNAEHLARNLFVARVPFCLLTVAMTWVLFGATSRRFGARAGLAAAALLAFNPNVLAHGRLAALDAGTAALMFIATVAFLDLLERPGPGRTLWAGVAFGLAQAAKFTSLLVVVLFGVLALVAAVRSRSRAPLVGLARVVLVGLTVFAACYGFESKSANEAWNRPAYTVGVPGELPEPDELAARFEQELERAGLPPDDRRRLATALGEATADSLPDLLGRWMTNDVPPGVAAASLAVVPQLRDAPGELRKLVFAGILGLDGLPAEARLEALSALADRTLLTAAGDRLTGAEGVERWRGWFGTERYTDWDQQLFTKRPFELATRGLFGDARQIPLFSALRGVDYQLYHGGFGHGSYYRGRTLMPGRDFADGNPYPEYYSVVMGIKNPLGFLIAIGAGLLLAFVPGRRFADRPWTLIDFGAFVGLPLLAFYLFSTGNALMGVRYVLPVFPFLALLVGRVERAVPRAGLALAGLAALESLWIHPHQLMYFNLPAGGPTGGPSISVVGDDWGQDVRLVGEWMRENRELVEQAGGLHYEPYTMANLSAFGLEQVKPIDGPVRGLVAVNAINRLREANDYAWLDGVEPFARLGWSVWIYDTR